MREQNIHYVVLYKNCQRTKKLFESGQVKECQQLLEQTLSVWEKLEVWENYILVRNKIGRAIVESGTIEDFEAVERYLEETLKMAQNRLNEKNKQLEGAYNLLGFWYGTNHAKSFQSQTFI